MKARENKVLKFLEGSDKRFIIPVYQRPYSWKKEHCVQLMKDLNDVCNYGYNSHFFGSIVFVLQHDGACEEHIIIDGQQRLTTISLLLPPSSSGRRTRKSPIRWPRAMPT